MTRIEYKVIVEEIARIFDTIPNDGSRRLAEQWIADKFAEKDAEVKRLREACREVVVAIHEGKLDATSREASEKLAPLIERLIEIIVPQTTGASDAVAK